MAVVVILTNRTEMVIFWQKSTKNWCRLHEDQKYHHGGPPHSEISRSIQTKFSRKCFSEMINFQNVGGVLFGRFEMSTKSFTPSPTKWTGVQEAQMRSQWAANIIFHARVHTREKFLGEFKITNMMSHLSRSSFMHKLELRFHVYASETPDQTGLNSPGFPVLIADVGG